MAALQLLPTPAVRESVGDAFAVTQCQKLHLANAGASLASIGCASTFGEMCSAHAGSRVHSAQLGWTADPDGFRYANFEDRSEGHQGRELISQPVSGGVSELAGLQS